MVTEPENTGKKQDGKFKSGQSGNPKGKPKGAINLVTRAVQDLLAGQHEQLTQAAIDKALEGDVTALRLCLDRIAPVKKDNPVSMDLPPVKTVQDAVAASESVLAAVSNGDVTPDEAGRVMALLHTHKGLVETSEFEARLKALEEANG